MLRVIVNQAVKAFRPTCFVSSLRMSSGVFSTKIKPGVDLKPQLCYSVMDWSNITAKRTNSRGDFFVLCDRFRVVTREGGVAQINCSSVMKKRRKKMNKHKYKKLRKKMKFLRRRLGK